MNPWLPARMTRPIAATVRSVVDSFTSCSALGLLRVHFVSMSGESINAAAVESIDTEEEVDRLVQDVLDSADTTLEELREQGKLGRFDTEQQRQAWHILAGTGRL